MNYINIHGLIIIIIIMIPNIIFAMKENHFKSKYNNKIIEVIERIGRFGSIGLMIFNIPFLNNGYRFTNGRLLYIFLTSILSIVYCFVWFLYFKIESIKKAMLLAIIPTIIFLLSGIIQGKVLLILLSVLFGISHIIITYYNNI